MSIISKCEYCLPEVNEKRTYRKQTEVYDSIGIDVPMCWNCGEAALFERNRIIKLLEPYIGCRDELCYPYCSCFRSEFAIELIKGGQK